MMDASAIPSPTCLRSWVAWQLRREAQGHAVNSHPPRNSPMISWSSDFIRTVQKLIQKIRTRFRILWKLRISPRRSSPLMSVARTSRSPSRPRAVRLRHKKKVLRSSNRPKNSSSRHKSKILESQAKKRGQIDLTSLTEDWSKNTRMSVLRHQSSKLQEWLKSDKKPELLLIHRQSYLKSPPSLP